MSVMFRLTLVLCFVAIASSQEAIDLARLRFCPAPCGFPTISLGGFEFYIHTSSKVNWFEAVAMCEANGLKLLSIETAAKNNIIKRALAAHSVGTVFWTSGNDLEVEGSYKWYSTNQPLTFLDWANPASHPGFAPEPQNLKGNEHCIFVGPFGKYSSSLWYDAECEKKLHFICEKPKE